MAHSAKITWIPLVEGDQTLITNGNGTHPWRTIRDQANCHGDYRGYQVYSDTDGIYLWLVDMDGNVGMLDAGETSWSGFEDWLGIAFDPERCKNGIQSV